MVLLALCDDWPLLVRRYSPAVLHTLPTQSGLTHAVIAVLIFAGSAPHASKLPLLLRKFYISQTTGLYLVIGSAGPIEVDVHKLAAEAVMLLTVSADLRALFELAAQRADVAMVDDVHINQFFPAGTEGVDVGDQFSWFGLVEFFR